MARTTGVVTAEMDGITQTLKAVQSLQGELRSAANAELRQAARTCASGLVQALARAAESSGVPVARRVARAIRVKSDRLPVVTIGGAYRVGRNGAPAGALVWGSEQGPKSDPNRFAVAPSSTGYWIAPTVERFRVGDATATYKRAVYDLLKKNRLV